MISDLELFLRMSGRPTHHWGYLLLASLGTNEAEIVRSSQIAEAFADFSAFKNGVEALFGKFEFEALYRASLCTHAKAGSYSARTTDICSKAYAGF